MEFRTASPDIDVAMISIQNGDYDCPGDVDILLNGEIIAYFSATEGCLMLCPIDKMVIDDDVIEQLDTTNNYLTVYEDTEL